MTLMADRLNRKPSWRVLRKGEGGGVAKRKEGPEKRLKPGNDTGRGWDHNRHGTQRKQEKHRIESKGERAAGSAGAQRKRESQGSRDRDEKIQTGGWGPREREPQGGGAGELNLIQNAPHRGQTPGGTETRGDQ